MKRPAKTHLHEDKLKVLAANSEGKQSTSADSGGDTVNKKDGIAPGPHDKDSLPSNVEPEKPLEPEFLMACSSSELAALELHKADMRRKRFTRSCLAAGALLTAVAILLMIISPTVTNEDLGLTPLPPLPRTKAFTLPVVPEWWEKWKVCYEDKVWDELNDDEKDTPERLKPHLLTEEKGLAIASEIANKHDAQYVPAMLRVSDSFYAIASCYRTDFALGEAAQNKAYQIDRKILGGSHVETLRKLYFLSCI